MKVRLLSRFRKEANKLYYVEKDLHSSNVDHPYVVRYGDNKAILRAYASFNEAKKETDYLRREYILQQLCYINGRFRKIY